MARIAFRASSLILVHVFFFFLSSLHCILHSSFLHSITYLFYLKKKKKKNLRGSYIGHFTFGCIIFSFVLDGIKSHIEFVVCVLCMRIDFYDGLCVYVHKYC